MNKGFRVEMRVGQDQRQVDAVCWEESGPWIIFFEKPPQGGIREYWRVKSDDVVAIWPIR